MNDLDQILNYEDKNLKFKLNNLKDAFKINDSVDYIELLEFTLNLYKKVDQLESALYDKEDLI